MTTVSLLSCTDPFQVFPCNLSEALKIKRQLSSLWHPDRNNDPRAADVLAHLNILWGNYNKAREGFVEEAFQEPSIRKLTETHFISPTGVYLWFSPSEDDLRIKALSGPGDLSYPTPELREKFKLILPVSPKLFVRDEGSVLYLKNPLKTPNVRLRDLVPLLSSRDACWIVSRLLNILCLLNYAQVHHYGITLDNLFVNPEGHEVLLLGGWETSCKFSELPLAVSDEASKYFHKGRNMDNLSVELSMVHDLARTVFGDPSGVSITYSKDLPGNMKTWLVAPKPVGVVAEYETWNRILETAWGGRKFVELRVSYSDLYSFEAF